MYRITLRKTLLLGIAGILSLGFASSALRAQFNVTNDFKVTTAGDIRQVIINRFTLNDDISDYEGLLDCEYPPGSQEEHLQYAGLWIGGITPDGDTLVTVGESQTGYGIEIEMWPSEARWDTVWVVDRDDPPVDIGGIMPDGEEEIYWEDYEAVGAQDFITRYNDYNILNTPNQDKLEQHNPMYLDVIQTTYSWGTGTPMGEVLIWTYRIIPTKFDIDKAYLTLEFNGEVGRGEGFGVDPSVDDRSRHFPEYNMVAIEDGKLGPDSTAYGPLGMSIYPQVDTPDDSLTWTYLWGSAGRVDGYDAVRYRKVMSSGEKMEEQQLYNGGNVQWHSVGPFDIDVGDTLTIHMAEVVGEGLQGMLAKAELAQEVIEQDFQFPSAPPSPPLRIHSKNKAVTLDWTPTAESNPETYTDESREDDVEQPFEGYRVYKSTVSLDGPWTLLGEYDIAGNPFGQNAGLINEYTDRGLLNNVAYYYSVTSFSKPDTAFPWPSVETSIYQSARKVIPGTRVPESVGEITVVPNPYRGDVDYTRFNPPWEQSPTGRPWMEQDRRIQFINLPKNCRIDIYTAAGGYVETLTHHSAEIGTESWNLTSVVNQAVASGVYLFVAEDLDTGERQVGKFVIIK